MGYVFIYSIGYKKDKFYFNRIDVGNFSNFDHNLYMFYFISFWWLLYLFIKDYVAHDLLHINIFGAHTFTCVYVFVKEKYAFYFK